MERSAKEAVAFTAPALSSELTRLEPLVGTWIAEDKTRDSVLGPGVRVQSVESFSWFDGRYFLVSSYTAEFGDEPVQTGTMYWGYDEATQRFHTIFFSNNGPFTQDGNRYEGVVEGDVLTFVGPARFRYQLDRDGRIKVNSDGTITVEWWLRDERGQWQSWMTNRFRRIEY